MRITELTGALGRQAEVSSARFLRGRSEALGWVLGCVVLLMPVAASAQATYRPTRPPIVTAESERWYLEGQPITYWGSVYYPAGPAVFFNPNEMARSGDYKGIPLYAMKTRDLFDVVFVPVGSGLLKPYERRRDEDVAGTVGNSAPSFPVDRDYEPSLWDAVPQAAGPPVLRQFYPIDDYSPMPASASPLLAESGAVERTAAADQPRGPLTTALKPTGLNAFYIDYQGRRWFSNGRAVLLDPAKLARSGEYHGFAVYASDAPAETIYVAVTNTTSGLLTPYSTRK